MLEGEMCGRAGIAWPAVRAFAQDRNCSHPGTHRPGFGLPQPPAGWRRCPPRRAATPDPRRAMRAPRRSRPPRLAPTLGGCCFQPTAAAAAWAPAGRPTRAAAQVNSAAAGPCGSPSARGSRASIPTRPAEPPVADQRAGEAAGRYSGDGQSRGAPAARRGKIGRLCRPEAAKLDHCPDRHAGGDRIDQLDAERLALREEILHSGDEQGKIKVSNRCCTICRH